MHEIKRLLVVTSSTGVVHVVQFLTDSLNSMFFANVGERSAVSMCTSSSNF